MHTEPTTYSERKTLADLVEGIRMRLPHPIAPLEDVAILWDETMTVSNGILGNYSVLKPREIKLAAYACHTLPMITPVLCHELRHMHQYHCYGVGYLIAAIPGLRLWTIEPSAYAVQEAAEELLFK